jgi:hypothetical protein
MEDSSIKSILMKAALDFLIHKSAHVVEGTVHKLSQLFSIVAALVVVLLGYLFFFIFVGIGISYYISELLGKVYYGFFCMALFYLIMGWIFWLGREFFVKRPVQRIVMNEIRREEEKLKSMI